MKILFHNNCPQCKLVERKLKENNIEYTEELNLQEVIDKGYMMSPVLKLEDNTYLEGAKNILNWLNNLE